MPYWVEIMFTIAYLQSFCYKIARNKNAYTVWLQCVLEQSAQNDTAYRGREYKYFDKGWFYTVSLHSDHLNFFFEKKKKTFVEF